MQRFLHVQLQFFRVVFSVFDERFFRVVFSQLSCLTDQRSRVFSVKGFLQILNLLMMRYTADGGNSLQMCNMKHLNRFTICPPSFSEISETVPKDRVSQEAVTCYLFASRMFQSFSTTFPVFCYCSTNLFERCVSMKFRISIYKPQSYSLN